MVIDAYLGTIMMVGFGYAPKGWMLCDGSLLPIQEYSALFTLLGVAYGGDGVKTFGLPDLRGSFARGVGPTAGGQTYQMGEKGPLGATPSAGKGEPQFLGVNFIICYEGAYPSRP